MFFQGEMMECALCGRRQRSDPDVESGWTLIELEDDHYYVCTRHLNSQIKDYEKRWEKILRKLSKMSRRSFWL